MAFFCRSDHRRCRSSKPPHLQGHNHQCHHYYQQKPKHRHLGQKQQQHLALFIFLLTLIQLVSLPNLVSSQFIHIFEVQDENRAPKSDLFDPASYKYVSPAQLQKQQEANKLLQAAASPPQPPPTSRPTALGTASSAPPAEQPIRLHPSNVPEYRSSPQTLPSSSSSAHSRSSGHHHHHQQAPTTTITLDDPRANEITLSARTLSSFPRENAYTSHGSQHNQRPHLSSPAPTAAPPTLPPPPPPPPLPSSSPSSSSHLQSSSSATTYMQPISRVLANISNEIQAQSEMELRKQIRGLQQSENRYSRTTTPLRVSAQNQRQYVVRVPPPNFAAASAPGHHHQLPHEQLPPNLASHLQGSHFSAGGQPVLHTSNLGSNSRLSTLNSVLTGNSASSDQGIPSSLMNSFLQRQQQPAQSLPHYHRQPPVAQPPYAANLPANYVTPATPQTLPLQLQTPSLQGGPTAASSSSSHSGRSISGGVNQYGGGGGVTANSVVSLPATLSQPPSVTNKESLTDEDIRLIEEHNRKVRLFLQTRQAELATEQERAKQVNKQVAEQEAAVAAARESERIRRIKAEQEAAQRAAAEADRLRQIRAEQEAAARAAAEQERNRRLQAEQEAAIKAAAEQERARRYKAEQEAAAAAQRAAAEQERARRIKAEQEAAAQRAADEERLLRIRAEQEAAQRAAAEQERIRRLRAEQEAVARAEAAARAAAEQERLRRLKAEQDAAARAAAERAAVEQERVRRLKAEQEHLRRLREETAAAEQERIRKLTEENQRLQRLRAEQESAQSAAQEQERLRQLRAQQEAAARLAEAERERLTHLRAEQEIAAIRARYQTGSLGGSSNYSSPSSSSLSYQPEANLAIDDISRHQPQHQQPQQHGHNIDSARLRAEKEAQAEQERLLRFQVSQQALAQQQAAEQARLRRLKEEEMIRAEEERAAREAQERQILRARHDQNRAIQAARDAALSRSGSSSASVSSDGSSGSSPYESERSRPLAGSSPYAGSSGTPYNPTHGSPPYAGRPGTPPSSVYDQSSASSGSASAYTVGSSGSSPYAATAGSSGTPSSAASSTTGEYAGNAYSDDIARYSRTNNGSSAGVYNQPPATIYDNAGPSAPASLNNVRTPEPSRGGSSSSLRGSYSGNRSGSSSNSREVMPVSEAIPSISDDYVRRVVVSRQTPAQSSVVYANQTGAMSSSNRIAAAASSAASPTTTTNSGHKAAKISLQELPPDHDQDGIPGVAGKDYPTLTEIPKTSFSCGRQPLNGYYADTETACQVVHMCQQGGVQDSFLCPNGTIWNQEKFACQWWYEVSCATAPSFYALNNKLYKGNELDDNNKQGSSSPSSRHP